MADKQPQATADARSSSPTAAPAPVHFGASASREPEADPYSPTATPGWSSIASTPGWGTPVTGAQTPDPLLGHKPTPISRLASYAGNIELNSEISRRKSVSRTQEVPVGNAATDTEIESAPPSPTQTKQGVPRELSSFTAELFMVGVCSISLMLFSFLLGDMLAPQEQLREALGITNSELPWIVGAFNVANGLSVVVSGSLADLAPPKGLMVSAYAWLAAWNIVGAFSITPDRYILFFVVRAMQGLAIGVLVSGSMSILGRIYNPGIRKNRVFSAIAATAPLGFSLGSLQGGALQAHLVWIFGTNAILCGLCGVAAWLSIPSLRPAADQAGAEPPTLRDFDYIGAGCAAGGCVCLLFGLTQGPVAMWSPYTYVLIIVGFLLLVALFVWESKAARPLIPNRLWRTPGFTALMVAYFLGFGSFFGAWQFYALQFWLRIQKVAPITSALYFLPNAFVGIFATWIVSRTLHIFPGHYIYTAAMFAFTLGPVFFIPQTPNTLYWALSFPGVALVTFGPDLAFAAASIFITSNVPRSYQGSAGSLLVTNQNLSSAIMTSVADAIGTKLDKQADGSIGMTGLRDIWWFAFAVQLCAAFVVVFWVRIPKEEEKEHVS
ncbi:major facilitator superfamily domain-containing protein [Aspergillus undulatus]|uniref:major facilitator superfamily domain-containing protein n=1 Tax=Aspergillus undulatus TaxID=1810928 RepID=UPI003CCD00F6